MLNFTSHTQRGHTLALAPSTVPKCLPAWRRKSLLWLPSDLSLDCRKRGKGQICVGIRKRLLSEPLARKWVHSTTGDAGVSFSQNVCKTIPLSGDSSRRSIAAPTLLLYKTEKETLCKLNITSPTHCCMHHEKSSVSAHRWNKISWFWWRAKKENVGLPRDCICRHNASGDIIIKLLSSLVISRAHEVPLQPAQSILIGIWMELLVYQSSHVQSWAQIPSSFP